jgi:hypothetical protein
MPFAIGASDEGTCGKNQSHAQKLKICKHMDSSSEKALLKAQLTIELNVKRTLLCS